MMIMVDHNKHFPEVLQDGLPMRTRSNTSQPTRIGGGGSEGMDGNVGTDDGNVQNVGVHFQS